MNQPEPLHVLAWVGIGLLALALSALYSGLETGVYCLNKIRLRLRSNVEGGSARALQTLITDRTRLLSVLLIWNNAANYATTASASVLLIWAGLGEGGAELTVTVLVAPILFVFGEMVPKTLFRRHAETLVYRWTWLLRASTALMTWFGLVGLIRLAGNLALGKVRGDTQVAGLVAARQQILGMLVETAHTGTITDQQSRIAEKILGLHQVRLRDVMVPLHHVDKLPQDATRELFLQIARTTAHSRLPVYPRDRPERIVGVVTVLDGLLLEPPAWSLDKLICDAPKLPPSMNVQTALTRLQRARQPLGIVTRKSGETLGIVTVKDLVEEIVGELRAW
jgi:CBS domain containing-hemolysin-like protein